MSETVALTPRILGNDLRLYFRAWQRRGAGRFGGLILQILFPAWMHLAIYPLLARYTQAGALPGATEFGCLFVALLILMMGLQRSLEVLYNRGDLPMLLASPVPMRVVVLTRLADVQLTTCLTSGLLMLPLLNVAAWLFGAHWLWAWLAWLLAVMALVPCALLATLLAVRMWGARRARLVVQMGGLLLGLSAVAGIQVPNWMNTTATGPGSFAGHARFFAYFDVAWLQGLASAARGDPRWLGVLAVAGLGLGAGAFLLLVREFSQGAQAAAADVGTVARRGDEQRTARAWRRAFRETPMRAIVHKEFRLVRRDPLLIVRGSAQMVSLLPALVVVLLQHTAAGIAAFALIGPAIVAVTLASMMTLNDDATVFVHSSPLSLRGAAWARTLASAILPIVFAVGLAAGAALLGEPIVALVAAAGGIFNAVAMAWLGTCTVRPLSAEDRAQNRRPKIIGQYLIAMAIGGLGAAGVTTMAMQYEVAAAVLLTLALGGASCLFAARPKAFSYDG